MSGYVRALVVVLSSLHLFNYLMSFFKNFYCALLFKRKEEKKGFRID